MPLFLKSRICFIHVPKCGGTTVVKAFEELLGDPPVHYSEDFSKVQWHPLQHSPQHTTYRVLKGMNMVPDGFEVVSFVRDPVERFLSEYAWRRTGVLQDEFAERFFSHDPELFWDNHHLSQYDFLDPGFGEIEIRLMGDISSYFGERFGVMPGVWNSSRSRELTITECAKKLVETHWAKDFDLLESIRSRA